MLSAELVSIGTELLMGQIVNTNTQYLSEQLAALGISVFHHTTVGDNDERLKAALKLALSRADIVITTGGLGPTQDDITKKAAAELFALPMERDSATTENLQRFFKSLGSEMTPNNLSQADFPRGGIILSNDRGTAPGCIVECQDKAIVLLPGPPIEMTRMFERHVRAYLEGRSGVRLVSRVIRVFGMGESSVEHTLKDIIAAQQNPTIAPYAKLGEVTLRVTARCEEGDDAQAILAPTMSAIEQRLGDMIFSTNDEALECVVSKLLISSGQKIAIAESCSGGMLTSMLAAIPGISKTLLEGAVTYANEAKIRALGVSAATLSTYGAVSEETAREMAEGMRVRSGADVALATTGIAGPDGGTAEKPVGLVFVSLASGEGTQVKRLTLSGHRERIRTMACLHSLDLLRRYLLK